MVGAAGRRDDPGVQETEPRDVGILEVANRGFDARLERVAADDWGRATPCSEWDVRALVNHVVGANVRYRLLLHDAPLEEVEATRALDHLGDDPRASFTATAADVVGCFREPGVLNRTYRHAVGERTGHELLLMRVLDVGVHTWDLARAIGADEHIDDAVVAVALTATTTVDHEDDDEPPQDRLLLRTGRHPNEED